MPYTENPQMFMWNRTEKQAFHTAIFYGWCDIREDFSGSEKISKLFRIKNADTGILLNELIPKPILKVPVKTAYLR